MRVSWILLGLLAGCGPFNDVRWCKSHPDACLTGGGGDDTDVAPEDQLPKAAKKVMQDNCYACHGDGGTANGGFNFSLVVPRLIETGKVAPGQPDVSRIYARVLDGSMPPGPDKPSAAEIETLRRWIEAGAKDWDPDFCAVRDPMTPEEELNYMVEAVTSLPVSDRRYARFFVLSYLWNDCVSNDELATLRFGLSKAINSVSMGPRVIQPVPVDPDKLLYMVDARDYGWDQPNLNGVDAWEQAVKEIPVVQTRPGGQQLRTLTHSRLPYMPADWFVRHATQPPLYNAILRLPPTEDEFLSGNPGFPGFGVNRVADLQAHAGDPAAVEVMRAGFVASGVSVSNRLVERHVANTHPGGFCWVSYDMASEAGDANLLANPLSPADGIELFRAEPDCQVAPDFTFRHDGGEFICTLPNGLNAYYLATSDGNQLDVGPLAIVRDLEGPTAPLVTNGASCMFCHARGIIDKADVIGEHWSDHRDEPEYDALFPDCIADFVEAMYPGQAVLDQMSADRDVYQEALDEAGVPAVQETEPVFVLTRAYEDDLKLQRVAAELGLRTDHDGALADISTCTAELLSVDPALSFALTPLLSGETISREAFIDIAADVICGCSVVPHDTNQCALFAAAQVRPPVLRRTYALPPSGPCGPGTADFDCDGLTDVEERALGTSTDLADTDFDGLTDEEEVNVWRTDPLTLDTDGDGLSDGREVTLALNPLSEDTDGDRLGDNDELFGGQTAGGGPQTSPWNADTDGGGVPDGDEVDAGSDPNDPRDDGGLTYSDLSCGPAGIACLPDQRCLLADHNPYDTVNDVGACVDVTP